MFRPYIRTILLILFAAHMAGCGLMGRIVWYNVPNTSDLKIFPSEKISADTSHVSWDKGAISLPNPMQWVHQNGKKIEFAFDELSGFLDYTKTSCFVVWRNDSILYQYYGNDVDENDKVITFSMTKPVIGTLVNIAQREKFIESEDQLVSDFIPEFKELSDNTITLKHLLDMNSGLNESDYRRAFKAVRMYFNSNLDRMLNHLSVRHQPGYKWEYKSMEYMLLGICIERATKMPVSEYLKTRLWEKIGMGDANMTMDREEGHCRAFGGIAMRPMDALQIGKLYLNQGNWEGEQILDPKWVQEVQERDTSAVWWGYTNGWWKNDMLLEPMEDDVTFQAAGFHGQFLLVNPKTNTMILRTGHGKKGIHWGRSLKSLERKINPQLGHQGPTPEELAGTYQTTSKEPTSLEVMHLSNTDWKLVKHGSNSYKVTQFGHYDLRNEKSRVRLILDRKQGKIVGAYLDEYRGKLVYYKKMD